MTVEERRVPFRPNLTNVVRIVSREWLAWIKKGRTTTWVSNVKGHGKQEFMRREGAAKVMPTPPSHSNGNRDSVGEKASIISGCP
jgi:hypothetical protein